MNHLVIRGATVVDGLGNEPIRADVAVRDGRISAIGAVRGDAEREIDADGLTLAPGIVDLHTHLRRADHLGPDPLAVSLARGHDDGDGQLRIRDRSRGAARA